MRERLWILAATKSVDQDDGETLHANLCGDPFIGDCSKMYHANYTCMTRDRGASSITGKPPIQRFKRCREHYIS